MDGRRRKTRAATDRRRSVVPDGARHRPGSGNEMNHGGMNRRGFWIPARAPRPGPGCLAGMTSSESSRKPAQPHPSHPGSPRILTLRHPGSPRILTLRHPGSPRILTLRHPGSPCSGLSGIHSFGHSGQCEALIRNPGKFSAMTAGISVVSGFRVSLRSPGMTKRKTLARNDEEKNARPE